MPCSYEEKTWDFFFCLLHFKLRQFNMSEESLPFSRSLQASSVLPTASENNYTNLHETIGYEDGASISS